MNPGDTVTQNSSNDSSGDAASSASAMNLNTLQITGDRQEPSPSSPRDATAMAPGGPESQSCDTRRELQDQSGTGRTEQDRTVPGTLGKATLAGLERDLLQLTDYEILGELGHGGMGVVFKARQKSLGRLVALKMILGYADEEVVERFLVEARASACLNHPGIVPVFEVGRVADKPYFTMAFIEGGSLSHLLRRRGALPPVEAAELVRQVAQAVSYAHENRIIHRDLKPDNILLDPHGHPRIMDFGLAKRLDAEANLTNPGAVIGTPNYMAPEQARGDGSQIGPAADVYALGGILYTCLVRQPPFSGENAIDIMIKVAQSPPVPLRQRNPNVPAELEAICLRCLEKDPEKRYPSAAALVNALDGWLRSGTAGYRPASNPFVQLPSPGKNRRKVVGLVAAALLLLAGLGLGAVLLSSGKNSGPDKVAAATDSLPPTGQPVVNREFAEWLAHHPLRNDFNLQVDLGTGMKNSEGTWLLRDKDPIKLTVRSDRDTHLRIFTMGPDGTVIQLFPNKFEKDDLIRANVERQIPDPELKSYPLTTTVSTGDEHLFIVGNTEAWKSEPVGEEQNGFQVYYSEDQLKRFGEDLKRGILLKPAADGPQVSEAKFRYRVFPRPNPE